MAYESAVLLNQTLGAMKPFFGAFISILRSSYFSAVNVPNRFALEIRKNIT